MSGDSRGLGEFAVKRKNKVGFEREFPTNEAALEPAERLSDLLTLGARFLWEDDHAKTRTNWMSMLKSISR